MFVRSLHMWWWGGSTIHICELPWDNTSILFFVFLLSFFVFLVLLLSFLVLCLLHMWWWGASTSVSHLEIIHRGLILPIQFFHTPTHTIQTQITISNTNTRHKYKCNCNFIGALNLSIQFFHTLTHYTERNVYLQGLSVLFLTSLTHISRTWARLWSHKYYLTSTWARMWWFCCFWV